MFVFEKSVLIDCNISKVFEFHTDTNNLPLITPPGIKVEILKLDTPVNKGSEIELNITQFGFYKSRWNLTIAEFINDKLISDKQISGPFKSWIHHHIFEPKNNQTLMTDKIELELPFGILGKSVYKILVKNLIRKQFEFRHEVTKKLLEIQNQK